MLDVDVVEVEEPDQSITVVFPAYLAGLAALVYLLQ